LSTFGYQFAAINKVISYIFLISIIFWVSKKYFNIVLEKRLIKLLISSAITLSIIQLINAYDLSLFYSLIVTFILGLYWYFSIVNFEEKKLLIM